MQNIFILIGFAYISIMLFINVAVIVLEQRKRRIAHKRHTEFEEQLLKIEAEFQNQYPQKIEPLIVLAKVKYPLDFYCAYELPDRLRIILKRLSERLSHREAT